MMKLLPVLLLLLAVPVRAPLQAQNKKPTTLREVLLAELRSTHTEAERFVPANVAVKGLTAEQASWTDGKGNHSVGQLAYHLWFWDTQSLARFKGEKPPTFSGNNDETFNDYNAAQWDELQKKLNQVLADWEKAVESADDQKLAANASLIAHVGAHNAYHLGQIIYVRKLQGAWDPAKGVK